MNDKSEGKGDTADQDDLDEGGVLVTFEHEESGAPLSEREGGAAT